MLLLVTVHKGHLVPVAALENLVMGFFSQSILSIGTALVEAGYELGVIRRCIGHLMTPSGLKLDNHRCTTKVLKRSSEQF